MKNIECIQGLKSLRQQAVSERRNNDVKIFDTAIGITEKGLGRFSTEELIEELLNRESTLILENSKELNCVRINFIKEKIKFLENMSDGVDYAIEVAKSRGTGEHEDFKVYKEVLKEIAIDLNNIKVLLDGSAVG